VHGKIRPNRMPRSVLEVETVPFTISAGFQDKRPCLPVKGLMRKHCKPISIGTGRKGGGAESDVALQDTGVRALHIIGRGFPKIERSSRIDGGICLTGSIATDHMTFVRE